LSERPGGVVRVERTFDAPIEAVFEAWTSPEVMRRWFHVEPDWQTPEAQVDLKVGGAFRVLMRRSDDSQVSITGHFTEVDPPRRLVLEVVFSDLPSNEQQIELTFTESEGCTTVLLVNSGIATDERRDAEDYGWRGCLDQLGRTLVG
jgi:uncharacterized protein YndB with AHSA1/START domain